MGIGAACWEDMFRTSALPSREATDAVIDDLSRWARNGRAVTLAVCLAVGVTAGLVALDRLQIWAHVYILAYGSVGLGAGFVAYRFVARPALRRALRRRARRLASVHALPADEIELVARAYLM